MKKSEIRSIIKEVIEELSGPGFDFFSDVDRKKEIKPYVFSIAFKSHLITPRINKENVHKIENFPGTSKESLSKEVNAWLNSFAKKKNLVGVVLNLIPNTLQVFSQQRNSGNILSPIVEKFTVQKECNPFNDGNLSTDKPKKVWDDPRHRTRRVSASFKNRPMESKTGRSSPQFSDEIFSIHGVDGLDLDVTVEFEIYHGSGAADDLTEITINDITVDRPIIEADMVDLNTEEYKIISAVKLAVKSIYPTVQPGILIPKGTDVLELNKKMRNYLKTDIDKLRESLYEKYIRNY